LTKWQSDDRTSWQINKLANKFGDYKGKLLKLGQVGKTASLINRSLTKGLLMKWRVGKMARQ
jgi:hypothetical protein